MDPAASDEAVFPRGHVNLPGPHSEAPKAKNSLIAVSGPSPEAKRGVKTRTIKGRTS